MNPIHNDRLTVHRVGVDSLEPFTDLGGHTNGPEIIWRNEADDVIDVCGLPRPLKGRQRRLSREAIPPSLAVEYPAQINSRPFRSVK